MRKPLQRTTLTVRKYDVEFTRKFFMEESRKIFQQAAIEFVQRACADVPSLTGQAKAALINVANSIGVDAGIDPFDPPISKYEHLQVSLWLMGNTPKRGKTMGKSRIQEYKNSIAWEIRLNITAAHNGFEYFTYWDNMTWHSIDAALESANKYIQGRFTSCIKVRTVRHG